MSIPVFIAIVGGVTLIGLLTEAFLSWECAKPYRAPVLRGILWLTHRAHLLVSSLRGFAFRVRCQDEKPLSPCGEGFRRGLPGVARYYRDPDTGHRFFVLAPSEQAFREIFECSGWLPLDTAAPLEVLSLVTRAGENLGSHERGYTLAELPCLLLDPSISPDFRARIIAALAEGTEEAARQLGERHSNLIP